MADKKQYYGLDEIGFLGMQGKRSNVQVKKDIEKTVQFVKTRRSGTIAIRRKRTRQLSKVK